MAYARFNLDVPDPEFIGSEREALEVRRLFLRKVELEGGRNGDWIGFDTETNALRLPKKDNKGTDDLDWMKDTITFWGLSAKFGDRYRRFCLRGEDYHHFVALMENPDANLCGWNMNYDAHISWNHGIDIYNANSVDSQIGAFLLDENLHDRMGLKDRAKDGIIRSYDGEFEGVTPWKALNMTKFKDLFKGCIDPETGRAATEYKTALRHLPRDLVCDYTSLDPYATLLLHEHISELLACIDMGGGYSMLKYFHDFEVPITRTLFRMERRGIDVDLKFLEGLIPQMQAEIDRMDLEINREAGWPVNLNSNQQLNRLLFGDPSEGGKGLPVIKWTKGGAKGPQPSTDASVLEILAAEGHEIGKFISRRRRVAKLLNTYVWPLVIYARHHRDGRIHSSVKQYGARTGRFSYKAPNGQNMPRNDNDEWGVRYAFITRPGWKLLVGDYAQLEMRILAHYSKDKRMIAAILDGKDLHCQTVALMMGIHYEEVYAAKKCDDPDERQQLLLLYRQQLKSVGFGIMYGAGPSNISKQLEIPKKEAKQKIDEYLSIYPGVKLYMREMHARCRRDGHVTTIINRRRRLPDIHHHEGGIRSHAERESINAPIQGSASDLTKAAMLNVENSAELNMLQYKMLLQVHDELVGECPEENVDRSIELVTDYMMHPFADGEWPLAVPVPVDVRAVDRYSEAK
jgi:DNA polymerase I-like protein with 3'-5' exonuclease and polymerase domains